MIDPPHTLLPSLSCFKRTTPTSPQLGFSVSALGMGVMIDPADGQGRGAEMSLARYELGFILAWCVGRGPGWLPD